MSETAPDPRGVEEIPAWRNWKFWAGSLITLAALSGLGYWAWQVFSAGASTPATPNPVAGAGSPAPTVSLDLNALPDVSDYAYSLQIRRTVDPHTNIPDRGSDWVAEYTVKRGDSLSKIATIFGLKWQSILWANTATLKDDPNYLQPGKTLYILPIDGAFYQWKEKDTLESVAGDFSLGDTERVPVVMDAIINWPGNEINPLAPVIQPGTWVIIPGGKRPFIWEAPMVITGTTRTWALGPGVCAGRYGGTPGTGGWVWPTANHDLSGYDFGAGHNGIDIRAYIGQPIYATDNGVVVFAGWSDRGYGNLVIIDHLDGWHTFYAHLNALNVNCGAQMFAGMTVGYAGTTGNSTGPHLHFEMRYNGGAQNPWGVLP
jgi:murein DD-endopeptidase MepM/ murein hydrolase activator NlpD